jgi:hypothetical protein
MSNHITPPGIVGGSSLFKPKSSRLNNEENFFLTLLITADTKASPEFKKLEEVIEQVGRDHFGTAFESLRKSRQIRLPLRYDVDGKNWPKDMACFLNINTPADQPPIVVGRDAQPIMDPSQIYSGCKARASVRFFGYGSKGSPYQPGVGVRLQNVQKLGDGPRLANARPDGSEFGKLNDDDFSDLL